MNIKGVFLTFICISISLGAIAQTEKGIKVIGGVIAYSNTVQEIVPSGLTRTERFEFIPTVNYFIVDNLSVGMGIGYTHGKISDKRALTVTNSDFLTVSPNVKLYLSFSEWFQFFGQLNINSAFGIANSLNEVNPAVNTKYHEQRYGVTLAPGFAFFPTRYLGLEFSFSGIGYSLIKGRDQIGGNSYRITSFDLGLTTFTPKISMNYYF